MLKLKLLFSWLIIGLILPVALLNAQEDTVLDIGHIVNDLSFFPEPRRANLLTRFTCQPLTEVGEWTTDPDAKQIRRFQLSEDLKWSNGQAVGGAEILAAVEVYLESHNMLKDLCTVSLEEENRIRLVLSPEAIKRNEITNYWLPNPFLVSAEGLGTNYFKAVSRTQEEQRTVITLEHNEYCSKILEPDPGFTAIRLQIYSRQEDMQKAFLAGEIDVLYNMLLKGEQITSQDIHHVYTFIGMVFRGGEKRKFRYLVARNAMVWAIDGYEVAYTSFPGQKFIPEQYWHLNDHNYFCYLDAKAKRYYARARVLWQKKGIPELITVATAGATDNPQLLAVARNITDQLNNLGFTAELITDASEADLVVAPFVIYDLWELARLAEDYSIDDEDSHFAGAMAEASFGQSEKVKASMQKAFALLHEKRLMRQLWMGAIYLTFREGVNLRWPDWIVGHAFHKDPSWVVDKEYFSLP